MNESLSDIINNNRLRAGTSIISNELQSDIFKTKKSEQEMLSYWDDEIKYSGLGYLKAIQLIQEDRFIAEMSTF